MKKGKAVFVKGKGEPGSWFLDPGSWILDVPIVAESKKLDNIPDLDFRQEMRDFVIGISNYSKYNIW